MRKIYQDPWPGIVQEDDYISFPSPPFISTQEYASKCPPVRGKPEIKVVRTAFNYVSQESADAEARQAAMDIALGQRLLQPC